ncbi:DUF4360 domain-containing protein [Frankia sp. Cr1]|uniref:DUF4360 domain-containing protein n=1 Tax=Frankia sp. Cr1 TaxID=3073931 RepID=UPI002AD37504|nr:DUF4360 domain-containing protein [Frankia sp. Cr1]
MSFSEAAIDYPRAEGPQAGKRKPGVRILLLALIAALAATLVTVLLPKGTSHAATFSDLVPAPADPVTIDVKSANGSGCPSNTANVAMSEDNTAFTVTYSDFLAQTGVGAKPTDFRKNCQLNLLVHVPQGFTYAIAQADYRGFASLANGANGQFKANYYFQGMSETLSSGQTFKGSYSDNWQTTDKFNMAALVFKPCGDDRNFNINNELRVNAGTSDKSKTTSFMSMDSTDVAISTIFRLQWAKCPTS